MVFNKFLWKHANFVQLVKLKLLKANFLVAAKNLLSKQFNPRRAKLSMGCKLRVK